MTGLAVAQPKADPKAADTKMAPKADAKAPAMAEMKPPQELADMLKAVTGTWHCKGQGMDHSMKMGDMTATLKFKSTLNGWWADASFESKMISYESFTTYSPATKKWKRVMVETGGGWATGESSGMKDNKVEWELAGASAMGEFMFRDHEDVSDLKAGVKMSGEVSQDKGKNWLKVYEIACKK
jgi:hypothetical protein